MEYEFCGVLSVGYHAVVGPRFKTTATSNVFLNQSGTPQPSTPHGFLRPSSPPGQCVTGGFPGTLDWLIYG